MITSATARSVEPASVRTTNEALIVELSDARAISVPLQWFPRLFHGTPQERGNFELSHAGIHWSDLNEDIPIDGLLRGERSAESPRSIQRWLELRARGERESIPEAPLPSDVEVELKKMGIDTHR